MRRAPEERNELSSFLDRYPFASLHFLERVFGVRQVEVLLQEERQYLREATICGIGKSLATQKEANATLLGIRRFEIARTFALEVMGPEAVQAGLSPGFEAEGELLWNGKWWRLWVDIGGCAPEALAFIADPPRHHGDEVRDVILTNDRERSENLVHQVKLKWGGGQRVHIWLVGTDEHRIVNTYKRAASTKVWEPPGGQDFATFIRQRHRGEIRKNQLGEIAVKLDEEGWSILVEAGNNPFMTVFELAYLCSQKKALVAKRIARIKQLDSLGLIKTAEIGNPNVTVKGRKVISDLGLELLTRYWGTEPKHVHRFHPWPQNRIRRDRDKREYSLKWLPRLEKHQVAVRQFALAMIYAGRCRTHAIGGIDVDVVTTIGSRFIFKDSIKGRGKNIRMVKPDALIDVHVWKKGWLDGYATPSKHFVLSRRLLVELDRCTVPLGRIEERIQRYREVWPILESKGAVMVWVIDGMHYRELEILDIMKRAGIEGWTVLVERLVLQKKDPWWVIRTPTGHSSRDIEVKLSYESIGGMAPLRPIWKSTESESVVTLLNIQKWISRDLQRSPPKRGEQEWTRYKSV